jgi:hypothetical protein
MYTTLPFGSDTLASDYNAFGSVPGNHSFIRLSVLSSLLQQLFLCLQIVAFSLQFLIMETGKSWAMTSPENK